MVLKPQLSQCLIAHFVRHCGLNNNNKKTKLKIAVNESIPKLIQLMVYSFPHYQDNSICEHFISKTFHTKTYHYISHQNRDSFPETINGIHHFLHKCLLNHVCLLKIKRTNLLIQHICTACSFSKTLAYKILINNHHNYSQQCHLLEKFRPQ